MKNKISFAVLIAALFPCVMIQAQNPVTKVFEDWNTAEATQNTFQHSIVRSKGLGGTTYHYVAGATINPNGGGYDMLVSKYNSSGTILWTQTYNGAGNGDDVATDVQIDAVGNVYICGSYYNNPTDSSNAIVIKYNSAGTLKWVYSFNGAGSRNDGLAALIANGNEIYSVGTSWVSTTNKYDMLQLRLDSSGTQVWQNVWNYSTANLNDGATNLYAKSGVLYVAGGAQSATTTYMYAVLKIDPSNGAIGSSTVTGGTAFGIDKLTDIQTDATGNVFICGGVLNVSTGYDYKTIKMDSTLTILWSAVYTGSGGILDDIASGLYVDPGNNVIVTGYTNTATQGKNFATVKYSSTGTQLWASTFNGTANKNDSATAIVVGDTNSIYVTGYSDNGSTKDYWTLRYNSAGVRLWDIGYNSLTNGNDIATAMALDTLGNVIVTGQNQTGVTRKYTTVKYIEKSTLLPQDTIASASNSFVFTENRGQLFGTNAAVHPEVRFYTINGSPNVYFTDTTVSYIFAKFDTSALHHDTLCRVDMKFKGSNSDQRIRAMNVRNEYSNFFLGHIPDGRCHVQNYNQLVSFNVWNNVDIIYGSNQRGLKYYFICKPGSGGNPATQINLKYSGADSVKINGSGQLIIYTRYGKIIQPKAAAWQLDASGNYISLGWQPSYNIVATNEVKFTGFGTYNSALPIIIAIDWGNLQFSSVTNPKWSTYFGGTNDDWGTDIKVNTSTDEVFTTGLTYSINFPDFTGYDGNLSGSSDAYIGAFLPTRARKWVTYYGGSNYDFGSQLALGSNGFLYCTGNSYSTNFPSFSLSGSYNETSSSTTSTAYAIRLPQSNGFPDWGTRFGNSNTTGTAIVVDYVNNNSVYITGDTKNATAGNTSCTPPTNGGFPLCNPGGSAYFNNVHSSGSSTPDAYLAKFSATGQLQWSTYFGGNGIDLGLDLGVGSNNDLYIVGSTTSSTAGNINCTVPTNNGFPICPPQLGTYYQSSYAGSRDGFLTQFDMTTMQTRWSTYLGGSSDDVISSVDVASGGNVYVAGITSTSTPDPTSCATPTSGGFPNCSNAQTFSQTYSTGGGSEAFILRFKNENLIWGTYLGGSGSDGYFSGSNSSPVLAHDGSGNEYLALASATPNSSTGSRAFTQYNSGMNYNYNNGIDASVGTYATYEVVLYTFTPANQILWGTYFGGTGAITLTNPAIGEIPSGIACGGSSFFITGILYTTSQFPLVAPVASVSYLQGATTVNTNPGGGDAFITEFDISQVLQGLGDNNLPNENFISVFPNPANNGILNVILNSQATEKAVLRIYDVVGHLLYEQCETLVGGSFTTVDISGFSNGMYFIRVDNQNGNEQTEKFIINR